MRNAKVYSARLHFSEIEHFFTKPELSPFSQDYQEYSYTSGIEYLANELYAYPNSKEILVTLLLPPEKIAPDLEERTREAVQRYCAARVKEIEQDTQGLRKRALQGLVMTLAALVIFIAFGSELTITTSPILRGLGEVLIVIGWVYVWFPLDSLVFGVRHSHLDRNIYKKLMTMELTLKSAEQEKSS